MSGLKMPTSSTLVRRPVAMARSGSSLRKLPSRTRTKATTPRYWSYTESKMSARGDPPASPCGGGMRLTIASSTAGTPSPVLAEICRMSERAHPMTLAISSARLSGSAPGRSILLSTGMISRSFSSAKSVLARV